MLTCIGKKRQGSQLVSCTNTSETPNDSRWPDLYLCPECSASRIGRSPVVMPQILDLDKPNTPEPETTDEYEGYEFEEDDNFDLEEIEL